MAKLTPSNRLDRSQRARIRVTVGRLLAQASAQPNQPARWQHLEAAHIAGQTEWASHLRTHGAMLAQALRERRASEVAAQLLRLSVVPLGHLLNRLPAGNPGSGRVSAFQPQPVPAHLAELIGLAAAPSAAAGSQ